MKSKSVFFFLLFFSTVVHVGAKLRADIYPGIYQTKYYFPLLSGKTIGVVANQTSMIGRKHLVDTLKSSGFNIKCVFAPEHGFRGEKGAGEEIGNGIDKKTGIPVISLYGNHLSPDAKDLEGIDVMVFDIQDVGVRFYTYISTLQYVMEACAEHHIPLIILDRPNPHSFYIDGPVLGKKYSSFVGMQPVPIVYGMTIGEYAKMLNGEGWLKKKLKCDLKVIGIVNYFHNRRYELPIPPSPNLPDMDAVYLYPSVCLFEGTAISVGRGTEKPFRLIGFPGDKNDTILFTPKNISGFAKNPPYEDTLCRGIDLYGEGKKTAEDTSLNLKWLKMMYASYPDKEKFFTSFFEKLAGTDNLRKQIEANKSEMEIRMSWKTDINKFKLIRKKYLMYSDFE